MSEWAEFAIVGSGLFIGWIGLLWVIKEEACHERRISYPQRRAFIVSRNRHLAKSKGARRNSKDE